MINNQGNEEMKKKKMNKCKRGTSVTPFNAVVDFLKAGRGSVKNFPRDAKFVDLAFRIHFRAGQPFQ
jgi:(p)ppGpp synthase/HD superfamily hydrolase